MQGVLWSSIKVNIGLNSLRRGRSAFASLYVIQKSLESSDASTDNLKNERHDNVELHRATDNDSHLSEPFLVEV